MIIRLDDLPEQGRTFEGEESPEVMALEQSAEFHPAGPLYYDLYAQLVDGMLIVRGKVSAEMKGCCARCTQIFSTTVADSGFLRDYSDLQGLEVVDVTEDLREAILLNLPHFPLCDESCRGLCPQCGKDLNEGPCGCSGRQAGGAWDALDSLNL
ncbi:YceD family protein [Tichowtungia aerotolerans]|uniref:DUF177 domain-containing protein n=1 Tax=Tichowtungia aerotolerans TaxID=2697043 RepID=A0A6P1MDB8_9BACT|nr:DUF177 domain-containing protein [Tichowtungia aerotolerans]QHI69586.1 hypothetical protein GT409_08990 [Tichowtungia aerotolerans]